MKRLTASSLRAAFGGDGGRGWRSIFEEAYSSQPEENADTRAYTPDKAIQIAPVMACVGAITRALATAPLVLEEKAGGTWRPYTGTEYQPRWLDAQPSHWQHADDMISTWSAPLLIGGNSVLFVLDQGKQTLVSVPRDDWSLTVGGRRIDDPTERTMTDIESGVLDAILGTSGEVAYNLGGVEAYGRSPEEPNGRVLHSRLLPIHSVLWGTSPLAATAPPFRALLAADAHAELNWATGGMPSSLLVAENQSTIPKEAGDAIRQYFAHVRQNPRNRYTPLPVAGSWKWVNTMMNPEETQLLETRKHGWIETCGVYGVPGIIAGAPHAATQMTGLVKGAVHLFCINSVFPTARKLHLALHPLLPDQSMMRVRQDWRWLFEADLAERWRIWQRAIAAGGAYPSEARESLGLEYDETLDELFLRKLGQVSSGMGDDGGGSDSGKDIGQTDTVPTGEGREAAE